MITFFKKHIKFTTTWRLQSDGFTIIETLVAITILMIAVVGPLTVAEKGLTSAIFARDQVVASYLAQDAVEYVRAIRDDNVLAGNIWTSGPIDRNLCQTVDGRFPDGTAGSGGCALDTISDPLTGIVYADSGSGLDTMYQDPASGYYRGISIHGGDITTQFRRRLYIDIVYSSGNAEAVVTSVVTWQNGTLQNAVVLSEDIFNKF